MDTSGYNRIDDYLLGRLEGKELTAFELQLQADMDLAKKVSEQRQTMNLLRKVGDLEMKKEIQEVQAKFKEKEKSKPRIKKLRPWVAAAAAILLLVVSYFAFQKPSAQQLFDNNYVAYDTSFGDRNDLTDIKLAEASKFYQQKDFEQALPIFESVQSDFKNAKLQLMIGITYLELNQFEKAQESFDQIIAEKDPVFQYHGLWYSAMAYLKSGDIEKTKSQLQILVVAQDANGVYNQQEAKKLLKKL